MKNKMNLSVRKISLSTILGLAIIAALSVIGVAQTDTGWQSPTGTDDGFWPAEEAFSDDYDYAIAWNAATCHYWGYGFEFEPGMKITGIEVRLDAGHYWSFRIPDVSELAVRLTGDGGTNWSDPYSTTVEHGHENTYILGGPWDGWGQDWSPNELGDSEFGVRITAHMDRGIIGLNWVAVRIYYSSEFSMEIMNGENAEFPVITGPDTYTCLNNTSIRITSPDPWSISDSIIWEESTLDGGTFPEGFDQEQASALLARDYEAEGEAGQHTVDIAYQLDLTGKNLKYFRSGTYSLVIRYTATTDN
jgi:hypothetical protein